MPNYADYLVFWGVFFAPAKLIWIEFFSSVVLLSNFLGIVFWYTCSFMIKSKYFHFWKHFQRKDFLWCLPTGCFNWTQPHLVFLKMYFSERMKACFLWLLYLFFVNIIIIHVFPEKFIKICQVVQKIRRFFSSMLTFFVTFLDFLALTCHRETNGVSR